MWDWEGHRAAQERQRVRRYDTTYRARVRHPKYGTVIVPCVSGLAAVMNAAESWKCDWTEIIDATVENMELTAPEEKE